MALLFNRAWHDTATTGTGTITLGSARTGYGTFAEAGVANGNVVSYTIIDGNDFEIGIGTYTSAGTTLSRDTVTFSKIAGVAGTSKISLSGNATVFISPRSADLLSITETRTANTVFSGPGSGAAAAPTFRALVSDDIPALAASKITSGTFDAARIPAASDTAAGGIEIAIQSEMETATSNTLAVTPGRQHFHPSAAKVWCDWGVTTTINASYNVSSITDNGTGDWTVNYTTAFSAANYSVNSTIELDTTAPNLGGSPTAMWTAVRNAGQATTSVRIVTFGLNLNAGNESIDARDPTSNYVACYGDQ